MQKSAHLVVVALAAALLLVASSPAQEGSTFPAADFPEGWGFIDGSDFHVERILAPGIVHRFDSFSTGPLTINTAFIALDRDDIRIEVEKGKASLYGQERLPDMMRRVGEPESRPLVAVNADFWGTGGVPIGPFVDEGTIWKGPWRGEGGRTRSAFAFDDKGNIALGPLTWSITVKGPAAGQEITIERVNAVEDETQFALFTWVAGEKVKEPGPGQRQVVLKAESEEWLPNAPLAVTVTSVNGSEKAVTDRHTLLLHLPEPIPEWMTEGASLTIDAKVDDLPGKVLAVVGGLPRIVHKGRNVAQEQIREEAGGQSFATDLHPRTAIGLLKDHRTLVVVAVDGRQPRKSIGINLIDLADYMMGIGCTEAMNLDGGGSTTMFAENQVSNFPSDAGGPRAVSNAILFRRTAPLGPPVTLAVVPNNVTIPTGSSIELFLEARDAAGELVALDAAEWKVAIDAGETGIEVKDRRLFAESAGNYAVDVTLSNKEQGKLEARTSLTVENPKSLRFAPPAMLLASGTAADLQLVAERDGATPFYPDFLVTDVQATEFLTYDQVAHELKATAAGKGFVTAALGSVTARLPVAVDEYVKKPVYTFDALPEGEVSGWLQLTNANNAGTSITLERENKKSGDAAWRFSYAMARGGTTKIALPINVTLDKDAIDLGMWIYGDGNEHWLRSELRDAKGDGYLIDFTTSRAGISWKDEWKYVTVPLARPLTRGTTKRPAEPPFTVENIYIVQPQEAAKKDGAILLDELSVLDLPAELK